MSTEYVTQNDFDSDRDFVHEHLNEYEQRIERLESAIRLLSRSLFNLSTETGKVYFDTFDKK